MRNNGKKATTTAHSLRVSNETFDFKDKRQLQTIVEQAMSHNNSTLTGKYGNASTSKVLRTSATQIAPFAHPPQSTTISLKDRVMGAT